MNDNLNINLNLYRDFYLVCKYKSINKAASISYTSAPAISKSIKNLEKELNRQLFYRDRSGMILTESGEKLLYYIENSYNNLITANKILKEEDNLEIGSITIGIPSNICTFYLFDNITLFHNKYPNIEITLITGKTSELISMLKNHKVDFIIDTTPINVILNEDYEIKKLMKIKYSFVCSNNFNDIDIKSIKDLERYDLVLPIKDTSNRILLDELFNKYNIKINKCINLHTSEMILSYIKNNQSIGYVIENLVLDDKKYEIIDFNIDMPHLDVVLIYNKMYLTMTTKKFIEEYVLNKS